MKIFVGILGFSALFICFLDLYNGFERMKGFFEYLKSWRKIN